MNHRLKDILTSERPREKALKQGINSLSDGELLALIIGSGIKNSSVIAISEQLLARYQGLFALSQIVHPNQLTISGLGPSRKLALIAAFQIAKRIEISRARQTTRLADVEAIVNLYQQRFARLEQEVMFLVMLNGKKELIQEIQLYTGTSDMVDVNMREILVTLLRANTVYYIMIHNHPSGEVRPSRADRFLTGELKEKASQLGLKFFDHLIFGGNQYYSFREHEFWDE